MRGDFAKDLPSEMDDFYEFVADAYPEIDSSTSISESLQKIIADLHKKVNGAGTTLGEPALPPPGMSTGKSSGKRKKAKAPSTSSSATAIAAN